MATQLLTIAEVADRLRISKSSAYELIYAGRLTPRYVGTGKRRPRVRVAEPDLEQYIKASAG